MAGQGGADDETWKSLGPIGRKIYWAFVLVIALIFVTLFVVKLLQ